MLLIKIVAFALLFAVMIPISWGIKTGHEMLPPEAKWFFGGVPFGAALMLALGFRHVDDQRNRSD